MTDAWEFLVDAVAEELTEDFGDYIPRSVSRRLASNVIGVLGDHGIQLKIDEESAVTARQVLTALSYAGREDDQSTRWAIQRGERLAMVEVRDDRNLVAALVALGDEATVPFSVMGRSSYGVPISRERAMQRFPRLAEYLTSARREDQDSAETETIIKEGE